MGKSTPLLIVGCSYMYIHLNLANLAMLHGTRYNDLRPSKPSVFNLLDSYTYQGESKSSLTEKFQHLNQSPVTIKRKSMRNQNNSALPSITTIKFEH